MLQYLRLKNIGLAPDVRVDWAERINLIAGDNGLGKSFLLDLAWWALTRSWASVVALPAPSAKKATIEYGVRGAGKSTVTVASTFRRADESWPLEAKRPPLPGIVVYIRIDGGFSVWDPARNYWRTDPGRPAAYHFQAPQVWDGLDINGQRVCEGLERDRVNWQEGRKPQFQVLEEVLRMLSPPAEPLRVGQPQRVFLGEGRDRPTLLVATHSPLVAASLEPYFDAAKDDLIHLSLRNGQVAIDQGGWVTQGDASSWLVSETFGLKQAQSVEAERAIEAAETLMRGDKLLPAGLDTQAAIHAQLRRLLSAGDEFWPRWLVETNAIKGVRRAPLDPGGPGEEATRLRCQGQGSGRRMVGQQSCGNTAPGAVGTLHRPVGRRLRQAVRLRCHA